jgi:hypothetical protein
MTRKRKRRKATPPRQEILQATPVAPTAGPALTSAAPRDPDGLPSREALIGRLEAQRVELLRAMSSVNLAQRTIAQHVAKPPFAGEPLLSPEQHELYRQRVLEALSDAGEALRTAYPMLEGIAEALAVEQILKEHMSAAEASPSGSASDTSEAGPSRDRRALR